MSHKPEKISKDQKAPGRGNIKSFRLSKKPQKQGEVPKDPSQSPVSPPSPPLTTYQEANQQGLPSDGAANSSPPTEEKADQGAVETDSQNPEDPFQSILTPHSSGIFSVLLFCMLAGALAYVYASQAYAQSLQLGVVPGPPLLVLRDLHLHLNPYQAALLAGRIGVVLMLALAVMQTLLSFVIMEKKKPVQKKPTDTELWFDASSPLASKVPLSADHTVFSVTARAGFASSPATPTTVPAEPVADSTLTAPVQADTAPCPPAPRTAPSSALAQLLIAQVHPVDIRIGALVEMPLGVGAAEDVPPARPDVDGTSDATTAPTPLVAALSPPIQVPLQVESSFKQLELVVQPAVRKVDRGALVKRAVHPVAIAPHACRQGAAGQMKPRRVSSHDRAHDWMYSF